MKKLSNLKAQKTKLLKSNVETKQQFENIQNKLDIVEAKMVILNSKINGGD